MKRRSAKSIPAVLTVRSSVPIRFSISERDFSALCAMRERIPNRRAQPIEMVGFFRTLTPVATSAPRPDGLPPVCSRSQFEVMPRSSLINDVPVAMDSGNSCCLPSAHLHAALDTRGTEDTPIRKYSRLLHRDSEATRVHRICRSGSCAGGACGGKPPIPSFVSKCAAPGPHALVRNVEAPHISSPMSVVPQLHAITRRPALDTVTDVKAGQELLRPRSVSLGAYGQRIAADGCRPSSPTAITISACHGVANIRASVTRRSQGLSLPEGTFRRWKGVVNSGATSAAFSQGESDRSSHRSLVDAPKP